MLNNMAVKENGGVPLDNCEYDPTEDDDSVCFIFDVQDEPKFVWKDVS